MTNAKDLAARLRNAALPGTKRHALDSEAADLIEQQAAALQHERDCMEAAKAEIERLRGMVAKFNARCVHISQLLADVAALAQPSSNPWRDTVDDMLVTFGGVASDDPRESVNRLINWNVQVALDPAVSSDAQALIDQGKALAQPSTEQQAAEIERLRADAERYRWLRAQDDWRYRTYPGSMASCRWTSGNSPDEIDAAIDAAMKGTP